MKQFIKQFVISPMVGVSMLSNLVPSYPVPETSVSEIRNPISVKMDTQSPIPVMAQVYTPVITPGESRYQEEQDRIEAERKAMAKRNREVLPRDIKRTSDPGFEAKRALVKKIAAQKGIDWKVLEAVWQVESGKRWDSNVRSYAGATGPMQFMPGTFGNNGEDYDGDGVASIYDAEDSVAAAANLLKSAGLDRGDADSALFAYNHSRAYVAKVKRVASSIVE